ncbi:MAG: RiPP maturation radical SAM protein 1, partial [Syntrophobacteraceae bacterium]|nr:RiPP maturation radical SAM protein 1 [Syntrophobacteraceae bacterium]
MALVSTPWPLYNHPSIQLGTLKAFLGHRHPDLKVDAHHFFLKAARAVGYQTYQAVSERIWPAECLFAAMLFPERLEAIEGLYHRETASRPELKGGDFRKIVSTLRDVSEDFIHGTDWGSYGLAGFSVCLCQLTSSLYCLRRIKERHPDLLVVVGGSGLGGNPGPGFFKAFPEVDFLILGEGELPLARLVHELKGNRPKAALPSIAGVVTGESAARQTMPSASQLEHLKGLPPPDYDDYFQLLSALGEDSAFFPTLPAEMSRGCWWRRTDPAGTGKGCAFCNLNLQWDGYRSKDPSQIATEIDFLTDRHKALSIAFTDNVLPVEGAREVFEGLARLEKDLRMFGEIRASTTAPMLQLMRSAGFHEVQVGIEALGTRLLRKMNKGSSAIENLEVMKNCEEAGLVNMSNLILEFPGSDEEDVEETLRTLEFARVFRPLRGVVFWLGMGSPMFEAPHRFGLRATFNHPSHGVLFPAEIAGSMRFMIQGYRGDIVRQRHLWKPVRKKLHEWREAYGHHGGRCSPDPPLSFRDGRTFLMIHERNHGEPECNHRLLGASREIYLLCRKTRSIGEILAHFPNMPEDRVLQFLRMMVEKKLMFEERGKFLSLAVSLRNHSDQADD